MTRPVVKYCLGMLLSLSLGAQEHLPEFDAFPSRGVFTGVPASPQFVPNQMPDANPKFRQAVKLLVEAGPNFAGHFTLLRLSCGTSCAYNMAIVDDRNGRIYRKMPFVTLYTGGYTSSGEFKDYGGIQYRADSRLLIIEGCIDCESFHDLPTRTYYEWTGNSFREIKRVTLSKQ